MKIIKRYEIEVGSSSIRMPQGARVIHVGDCSKSICLRVIIDVDDRLDELRHFVTYEDGDQLPEGSEFDHRQGVEQTERYIGTVTGGPLGFQSERAWHVFERRA